MTTIVDSFSLSNLGLVYIYFKYMIRGDIKPITGKKVAPTKLNALPTLETIIANKAGTMHNIKVQNIFCRFDIPSSLYKITSIVFLHGSKHSGSTHMTEMFVMVLPNTIKLDY